MEHPSQQYLEALHARTEQPTRPDLRRRRLQKDLELQYPSYRLIEAGAEVVVAGHHVTSRRPDDLPDFCRGVLEVMSR